MKLKYKQKKMAKENLKEVVIEEDHNIKVIALPPQYERLLEM